MYVFVFRALFLCVCVCMYTYMHVGMHARQTDRPTDRQTDSPPDKRTDRQIVRLTDRQASRPADRQTAIHTSLEADSPTVHIVMCDDVYKTEMLLHADCCVSMSCRRAPALFSDRGMAVRCWETWHVPLNVLMVHPKGPLLILVRAGGQACST